MEAEAGGVYTEKSTTYEEVNQVVIKRSKNGKAPGIDGVKAEMSKCGDVVMKCGAVVILLNIWSRY